MNASLFFKHKGYSNEREYRFLRVFEADRPPNDMKSRTRPYSLVKYIEFNWRNAQNSLKNIVVGPAADFIRASRFAKDCLATFHSGKVDIDRSKIPYRGA